MKEPLPRQRAMYRTKLGRSTQDANSISASGLRPTPFRRTPRRWPSAEWPSWPQLGAPVTDARLGRPSAPNLACQIGRHRRRRLRHQPHPGTCARNRPGAPIRHVRSVQRLRLRVSHPRPSLPGRHGRSVWLGVHPRLLGLPRRRRRRGGLEARVRGLQHLRRRRPCPLGGRRLGLGAASSCATSSRPTRAATAQQITVDCMRILLLSPVFLGFGIAAKGILEGQDLFTLPALAPIVYNAATIRGAVAFWPACRRLRRRNRRGRRGTRVPACSRFPGWCAPACAIRSRSTPGRLESAKLDGSSLRDSLARPRFSSTSSRSQTLPGAPESKACPRSTMPGSS